ncbi:MAG: ATP-binding protein [Prevotellaceae bacterium]|nr:ATP-binding protein [Prevotellaceae bacterium]
MKFYDRKEEMDLLLRNEQQSREHATFTVLMGRRRIGKTTLLTHVFSGKDMAYLFVSRDSEALLCRKFQEALEEQIGLTVYGDVTRFRDLFEIIMKESVRRHFTVVIDEFQGLYRINPALFSDIQDLWDRYHEKSHINLIACGSIHSLMKRIFEDRSEPLYGRPTSKMTLHPFRIDVMKEILREANPTYTPEDLLCFYMLTGGVAKYIELLIDACCVTKDQMLDYVCRPDSYFLTEGHDLLVNEFQGEYSTYFSILQLIAGGLTRRREIDSALQKDTGMYLKNLDEYYELISKQRPLLSKPGGKVSTYEIRDEFLRFWFRFIYPYQTLVERGQLQLLRENIERQYTQFSGRTLERYFQEKFLESGKYTQVGNWWDRQGTNEIDIVAINEFDHEGVVAEVKRQRDRISIPVLEQKAAALPKASFGKYHFRFEALGMGEM